LLERKEKVESVEAAIETTRRDIQEKDDAFVAGLKAARAKGLKEKEALLQSAAEEETEIIQGITAKAQAELAEVREKIAGDVEVTRASLQENVDEFADAIGRKILGRAV
jgi:F-type H+-transporting ATPase subunit b